MRRTTDPETLRDHVPSKAFPVVVNWLQQNRVVVKVSPPRSTKLGDYRTATRTLPHRISVNRDLNPYAFLVTLVHEFAHYSAHVRYGHRIQAHGVEWKSEYRRLMRPYMSRNIFPGDVLEVLMEHLRDAAVSSCSDERLMRALSNYDPVPRPFLQDLPEHTVFSFNGRIFIKGHQLRRRFRCRCLTDRRDYLIDPLAEVTVNQQITTRMAS